MRRTTKIIIAVILVAILLLGIGYAAIQNITLNISGRAEADPSQANFKVKFSGVTEVSDASKMTASVTDDLNATINVTGLTSKGETAIATYIVQNTSADLSANLSVETTNSNTEFFTIESKIAKASLKAGEATTLLISVELIKTPITQTENATVGVQLTGAPVQPGEETTGGDESGTGTIGTTLAELTNANIGDYINLGNNVVGTQSTTDDWRILYADGERVYAILSDYLPNSTGYATSAGLDTANTYSVYSNTDRDTLLNGLTTTSNWSGLANGISGATVTGGPTAELLMSSYNIKNGTQLVYTDYPKLDSATEDYNLYVPHTEPVSECVGYWLALPSAFYADRLWYVSYRDGVNDYYNYYNITKFGVRPVVSLPLNINVIQSGRIWTVVK